MNRLKFKHDLHRVRTCFGLRMLTLSVLVAIVVGNTQASQSWVFPTGYDDTSPQTLNLMTFIREVERQTHNELVFELHSNESLYSVGDIYAAVQSNEVPIGEVIMSTLAQVDDIFLIDNLPFLATDFDQAWALWQLSKPRASALLADQGVRLLYATPWPPQGLFTGSRIRAVEELEGLRIRSYSQITEWLIESLNATPVAVPYTQIARAFEKNDIDAMITSPTAGVRSTAWNFVRYYSDINAWIPKNAVLINEAQFQALTPELQTAMVQAAEQAEQRGWTVAREDYFRSRITMRDNGMSVREPNRPLKAQFDTLGREMLEEWTARVEPATAEVATRFLDQR